MSDHYCCKKCNQVFSKCSCSTGFSRKSQAQQLREEAERVDSSYKKEESARYWLSVRAEGQKLCEEAIKECWIVHKERKRQLSFGEIFDENVAKKLVECLENEEFKVKLEYYEGKGSAYFHEDRASYWWVNISW